jgi:hypothetical protein
MPMKQNRMQDKVFWGRSCRKLSVGSSGNLKLRSPRILKE